jgi:hypothetical protein
MRSLREGFWILLERYLKDGIESVGRVPDSRWGKAGGWRGADALLYFHPHT